MNAPDLTAAERFLVANARVLERRRFERLVHDAAAAPVRDAVAAYRTADGGFGHALEPDGRCPQAQPLAVEWALRTLHEAEAWDDGLVAGALDWLAATAPKGGGAQFALPSIVDWPHAPWWVPADDGAASVIPTGLIAAVLHARRVEHPWLAEATGWLWDEIPRLREPHPYELRAVLRFLDRVPDRARAAESFALVAPLLQSAEYVALDPAADGDVHGPLDYAPLPDSLARAAFAPEAVDAALDGVVAGQRADGGWTFGWTAWSPVAAAEWRGAVTVDALALLHANGRILTRRT